jgi:hypothetical protein
MNVTQQKKVVKYLEKAQEKTYLAMCLLSDCGKTKLSRRADKLNSQLFQLAEDANDPLSLGEDN